MATEKNEMMCYIICYNTILHILIPKSTFPLFQYKQIINTRAKARVVASKVRTVRQQPKLELLQPK